MIEHIRKLTNKEKIKNRDFSRFFIRTLCNYFTASLSALPGLNAGTLLAAISISSPV